ncbi:MAG: histidine phosphatase family protein [Actinomycetota bacterium]|nr:histidine phosphatase family protein [Actinomycetota bacterium]
MGLQNRPVRIVLVRHGESQGNVDDAIYETVPDHALTLTDKGIDEASVAGVAIRAHIGDEPVTMYASPYVRARQTAQALALGVAMDDIRFEPRLREQDWANFQDPADVAAQKKLRDEYGHFYYRFTHGESGSDVYDRVSTFLESMFRSMDATPETVSGRLGPPMATQNIVIVTHGLTMRLFCMRWFHWSVEYFESLQNPVNGGVVVLVRQDDHRYKLLEPFVQWDQDYTPNERERASWS